MNTSQRPTPAGWIFQANPDNFPADRSLDRYVREFCGRRSTWYVGQEWHAPEIEVGQPVFVWRCQGTRRSLPGVVAEGVIAGLPQLRVGLAAEQPYEGKRRPELRALLKITRTFVAVDQTLSKKDVQTDPVLCDLRILKMAQGSNFPLTSDQVDRLRALTKNREDLPAVSGKLRAHIPRKLARIAFNSSGWKKPTGDARKLEATKTFNRINGFGYEDWLFRSEWQLNGWRYAFIQAFNSKKRNSGAVDLLLYTIGRNRARLAVGKIKNVEALNATEAAAALKVFKEKGWFRQMREEVAAVEGNVSVLASNQWAPNVLNVRFRLENVDLVPSPASLGRDKWIMSRHRYRLYDYEADEGNMDFLFRGRRAGKARRGERVISRRGSAPIEYEPIHERMQYKLVKQLRGEFRRAIVEQEHDWVDVSVRTPEKLILFEIKTDIEPFAVIRHALGQILEYAYHPARCHELPPELVIVGRKPLGRAEQIYLKRLQRAFPIEYRVVEI